MAGIINSGHYVGARFSEPKETPKVERKLTWSVIDTIKHMIYSALSGIAPQWSTKKLSNLHAKYNPPLNPRFAVEEARKALDKPRNAVDKLIESEKKEEAEERERVLPNRKVMLHGLLADKIFEHLNISREKAIDLLVKSDSLWPEGKPSITELSRHIYQNGPGRDAFVRQCRDILKPLIWTKEIEERLETKTGNRRRREEEQPKNLRERVMLCQQ